jgi:hypothetical protein
MLLETTKLKALLSLTKKKDKLVAQIKAIDEKLNAFTEAGGTLDLSQLVIPVAPKARKVSKGSRRKRSPKGFIDSKINEMLRAAGANGVSVKDVSESLNKSNIQISGWFSNKNKAGLVEKISKGKYRLVGAA